MEGMLSPADVAVLSGNTRNSSNDGFGGEGSWAWVLIFLIFAFGGWGRNGNGFGGGNGGSGAYDNYVLSSDFASLSRQIDSSAATTERKLDSISNGICDSTFALNNTITNGFAAAQNTLTQGFAGINQNIVTNGYENRLGTQSLSSQLASCCCDIRTAISDCCCQNLRGQDNINFNLSQGVNSLQNTMCNNTRDVIDSQNAGTRAILDAITANRIEDKNAQITAQQNEINALRLAASQERQNNYLVGQLKPCPIPSYQVPNPYCCYNPYANNCGCNGTLL